MSVGQMHSNAIRAGKLEERMRSLEQRLDDSDKTIELLSAMVDPTEFNRRQMMREHTVPFETMDTYMKQPQTVEEARELHEEMLLTLAQNKVREKEAREFLAKLEEDGL